MLYKYNLQKENLCLITFELQLNKIYNSYEYKKILFSKY